MNRMTKILKSSALVLALGGFLSGSAIADVSVAVQIDVDKEKVVLELIAKLKTFVILVDAHIIAQGAAESEAITNQVNTGNTVDSNAEGLIVNTDGTTSGLQTGLLNIEDNLAALIDHSVRDNVGFTQFNQDVGNMVNQSNVVSIALIAPDGEFDTSITESQAAVEQINTDNTAKAFGHDPLDASNPDKTATLDHSVRDNLGITQLNQNAGNMNNQANNLSVALGLNESAVVALSEADLGQTNTGNIVNDINTIKEDLMLWSVRDNTGITSVNQSTGNMNNQATSISFAAIAGPATLASGISITQF